MEGELALLNTEWPVGGADGARGWASRRSLPRLDQMWTENLASLKKIGP